MHKSFDYAFSSWKAQGRIGVIIGIIEAVEGEREGEILYLHTLASVTLALVRGLDRTEGRIYTSIFIYIPSDSSEM
jgi:reverse gyrase